MRETEEVSTAPEEESTDKIKDMDSKVTELTIRDLVHRETNGSASNCWAMVEGSLRFAVSESRSTSTCRTKRCFRAVQFSKRSVEGYCETLIEGSN